MSRKKTIKALLHRIAGLEEFVTLVINETVVSDKHWLSDRGRAVLNDEYCPKEYRK